MNLKTYRLLLAVLALFSSNVLLAQRTVETAFPCPSGYERITVAEGSFAEYLRTFSLLEEDAFVKYYNGQIKSDQSAVAAVLNIDVGTRDLQQCADAVMRLRSEYLYTNNKKDSIAFNFTSGDRCSYKYWKKGYRPQIKGNKVSFSVTAQAEDSYKNYKRYLNTIFSYAGTLSLSKELKSVRNHSTIKPGDVFIWGGSPGHAMTVMDVCINKSNGDRMFLLSQSYMPAQSIHIVTNPYEKGSGAWYSIDFGLDLSTPDWSFDKSALKKF